MLQRRLSTRLSLAIVGFNQPPSVVADAGNGELGIDPARRGVSIYEYDWQRLVQLSATEALQLLDLLREQEQMLVRMATEDTQAVLKAGRELAERSWQAPSAFHCES